MRQLGYLGKIPHRGDFVRYNVPAHLHRVWDDWLAEVLLEAGEALDDWPAGYDAAPSWRFALSPDIAGDEARAGVMLSSRDGVGRRYPFALFVTLPDPVTPLEALGDDGALDALEQLARQARDTASSYESLKAALAELQEALPEPAFEPNTVPFRPGSTTRATEPAVFCEDAELLADRAGTTRLLDAVLRQSTGPYSAWRCRDSDTVDGRLLITGGLPQGAAALALFGAEWSASAGGRLDGSARTDTRRPQELPRPATGAEPDPSTIADAPPMPARPTTASSAMAVAASAAEASAIGGQSGTDESGTSVTEDPRVPPASDPAATLDFAHAPIPDAIRDTSDDIARDEPGAVGHVPPPGAPSGTAPGSFTAEPAGEPTIADPPASEPPTDEPLEPLEVETLDIDDEEGDAPWDNP